MHFTFFILRCIVSDISSETSNSSFGEGSSCALGYDYPFFFLNQICYLHLYGTFLLTLLKQCQHHNTYVNWIRRNILYFEVEMKEASCQWLSLTEQSRAEQSMWVHKEFSWKSQRQGYQRRGSNPGVQTHAGRVH